MLEGMNCDICHSLLRQICPADLVRFHRTILDHEFSLSNRLGLVKSLQIKNREEKKKGR